MSDREIVKAIDPLPNSEVRKSLFDEAYNFCRETVSRPDARVRQAFVAGYGAYIGGMKNINELPEAFIKKPWETTAKTAEAVVPGLAAGAVLGLASPELLDAATAVGIASTASALWHTCVKLMSDKQLQKSMDSVFHSDDKKVMDSSIKVASEKLGPDAARYGIELVSALTGVYGPKTWKDISRSQLEDKLHRYWPDLLTTHNGASEIMFRDGSILHLHEDQAIYSIAGREFPLHASSNGVDMTILGSFCWSSGSERMARSRVELAIGRSVYPEDQSAF